MVCFPSSGAALAQLAAIVNPANKPTQIEMHLQAQIGRWAKNWLSYSVLRKMPLSNYSFFCKKRALPILFCHKSEPSKQYMSFRIIWKKIATIATLGTNQDSTLSKADQTTKKNALVHSVVQFWDRLKHIHPLQVSRSSLSIYLMLSHPSKPANLRTCWKRPWPSYQWRWQDWQGFDDCGSTLFIHVFIHLPPPKIYIRPLYIYKIITYNYHTIDLLWLACVFYTRLDSTILHYTMLQSLFCVHPIFGTPLLGCRCPGSTRPFRSTPRTPRVGFRRAPAVPHCSAARARSRCWSRECHGGNPGGTGEKSG